MRYTQLKATGIERGEATVTVLNELLERADGLVVDLGKDVEVVRQAVMVGARPTCRLRV